MRVAVCISGQMRSFKQTYQGIYDNIIKPNNADVFIHTWYDPNTLRTEAADYKRTNVSFEAGDDIRMIELYKPKKYIVEPPRYFSNPNIHVPESFIANYASKIVKPGVNPEAHSINNTMSMFYSIYRCNQLKEDYATEHNIYYDAVIKIRFDILVFTPIICSLYDLNYIHYPFMNHPDHIIADWINMGNNRVMNIYSSVYLYLEFLNSYRLFPKQYRIPNTIYPCDHYSWGNEHMIRDLLYMFNIQKRPFENMNFRLQY